MTWKKKLLFLFIGCVVYYLFIFLSILVSSFISYSIYPPFPPLSEYKEYLTDLILIAGNIALTPYRYILQFYTGEILVGIELILWFFYTFIYVYICSIIYRILKRSWQPKNQQNQYQMKQKKKNLFTRDLF